MGVFDVVVVGISVWQGFAESSGTILLCVSVAILLVGGSITGMALAPAHRGRRRPPTQ